MIRLRSLVRALALLGLCVAAAPLLASPALAATGNEAADPLIFRLAIFVLSIFVGYYVVWSVTPALHTPLMAVTNAISSVIIVGALIAAASGAGEALTLDLGMSKGFGAVAVALAAVNIFGGFLVTQRMLAMYKKKDKPASHQKPS
ncbi:NAD(P) transhydrogenase subunit alpha [bacterium]|nr:NAD(P) transhydrogenase subunit alpha [bacterium]